MLKDIQSTLPNKTKKGQGLTTPRRQTEHQLFTLEEESPEIQFRGRSGCHDRTPSKNQEQHINRMLVNKEEIIDKSLGIDQRSKGNKPVTIRDLVDTHLASLALNESTSTYLPAQNFQSIFLVGQMQRPCQRMSAPSAWNIVETVATGTSQNVRTTSVENLGFSSWFATNVPNTPLRRTGQRRISTQVEEENY